MSIAETNIAKTCIYSKTDFKKTELVSQFQSEASLRCMYDLNFGCFPNSSKRLNGEPSFQLHQDDIQTAQISDEDDLPQLKKRVHKTRMIYDEIDRNLNSCFLILGKKLTPYGNKSILDIVSDSLTKEESPDRKKLIKRKRRSPEELSDKKPMLCYYEGCEKSYTTKCSLYLHIKRHHIENNSLDKDSDNFAKRRIKKGIDINKVFSGNHSKNFFLYNDDINPKKVSQKTKNQTLYFENMKQELSNNDNIYGNMNSYNGSDDYKEFDLHTISTHDSELVKKESINFSCDEEENMMESDLLKFDWMLENNSSSSMANKLMIDALEIEDDRNIRFTDIDWSARGITDDEDDENSSIQQNQQKYNNLKQTTDFSYEIFNKSHFSSNYADNNYFKSEEILSDDWRQDFF